MKERDRRLQSDEIVFQYISRIEEWMETISQTIVFEMRQKKKEQRHERMFKILSVLPNRSLQ